MVGTNGGTVITTKIVTFKLILLETKLYMVETTMHNLFTILYEYMHTRLYTKFSYPLNIFNKYHNNKHDLLNTV